MTTTKPHPEITSAAIAASAQRPPFSGLTPAIFPDLVYGDIVTLSAEVDTEMGKALTAVLKYPSPETRALYVDAICQYLDERRALLYPRPVKIPLPENYIAQLREIMRDQEWYVTDAIDTTEFSLTNLSKPEGPVTDKEFHFKTPYWPEEDELVRFQGRGRLIDRAAALCGVDEYYAYVIDKNEFMDHPNTDRSAPHGLFIQARGPEGAIHAFDRVLDAVLKEAPKHAEWMHYEGGSERWINIRKIATLEHAFVEYFLLLAETGELAEGGAL